MGKQSTFDIIDVLKKATQGEDQRAVEAVLQRLYPDEDLKFSDLKVEKNRDGSVVYYHPQSNVLAGEKTIRPKGTRKEEREHPDGYVEHLMFKIPYRETTTLYSPAGHVHARIATEHATLPAAYDGNILVLKSIKEYYPPKKTACSGKKKTSQKDERQRARRLRAAAKSKVEFQEAHWQPEEDDTEAKPVQEQSLVGPQRLPPWRLEKRPNDFNNNANGHKPAAKVSPQGKIRREKVFSIPRIDPYIGYFGDHYDVSDFSLDKRLRKDQVNLPEGDYCVSQLQEGGGYMLTHFDAAKNPISCRRSEGEITAFSLREAGYAASMKKRKKLPPSGRSKRLGVRAREAANELRAARQEYQWQPFPGVSVS